MADRPDRAPVERARRPRRRKEAGERHRARVEPPADPAVAARRTPLPNIDGAESRHGDPQAAERLSRAFRVRPKDRDLPVLGIHGVHPYPARIHPAWVRALLADAPRDAVVLDPFCGSGTVLAEAQLSGRYALGCDVNEVALRVARLRTTRRDEEFLHDLARAALAVHERAEDRPPSPYAVLAKDERRFPPHVLTQLINLRDAMDTLPRGEVRDVCLLGMLPLLAKFGRKRGRPAPDVGRRAVRDAYRQRMEKLVLTLADHANAVPPGTPDPRALLGDARHVPFDEGSADLVISSPPYPSVYHYAAEQGLAAAWLAEAGSTDDLLAAARQGELGRRGTRVGSWAKGMRQVLRAIGWAVKPGGAVYFVVGDGVEEEVALHVDDALSALLAEPGCPLRLVAAVAQLRPHFHPPTQHLFVRRARREHLVRLERA